MAGYYSVGMSPMDQAMFMNAMQSYSPYGAYPATAYTPADATYASLPKTTGTAYASANEKNGSAGAVLAIGSGAALTILGVVGHNKGDASKKGLTRIWDGICKLSKGVFKGKGENEIATIRKNNDKYVVTLPGRKNVMLKGKDLKKDLQSIGITTMPKTTGLLNSEGRLAKGCELHRFVEVNYKPTPKAKKSYTILGKHDGSYVVTNSDGKVITDELSSTVRAAIEKHVKAIRNGEVNLEGLRSVTIRQTDRTNGVIHQFNMTKKMAKDTGAETHETTHIFSYSNYFPTDHPRVNAERGNNIKFDNAIKKVEENKITELKIADGSTVKLDKETIIVDGMTLQSCTVDRNGKVIDILVKRNGKDVVLSKGTSEYDSVLYQKGTKIEELINKTDKKGKKTNWKEIVYQAAA